MATTRKVLSTPFASPLVEFTFDDTEADPLYTSHPDNADATVQLMEVSGNLQVGIEVSHNLDEETPKSWGRADDPLGQIILLSVAGEVKTILQSGNLVRPRGVSGTGTARVRFKFSGKG